MALDLRNLMIRSYLIGVIGRPDANLPTYGDLHQRFGGGYQNQGRFLQAIYEDCTENEEPDLTVLVVGADTRLPSRFEGREWKDSPEVRQRWREAVKAVKAWKWSNTRFL
ncbi:hypothetical protein ACPCHT_36685 [Nucisporomicrobium flavum]|uniref:hypothetical protein n=1 Tax=Nucisporomicrobium flavum TaxID=2785915 RepID=UPI003C2B519F